MKKILILLPIVALLAAGCNKAAAPAASVTGNVSQTPATQDMAMPDVSLSANTSPATATPPATTTPKTKPVTTPTPPAPTPTPPTPPASTTTVKTFTITGSNFSFSPNAISVNKGDQVKITFKNADGFHNLIIDGYNLKTPTISGGQSADIEFVASQSGTFAFYCGVANHRAMGMQGTLTVK